MIPVFQPSCTQEEIDAVATVLASHWWGMGRECELLEKEFAEFVGTKHAISLNSATAGLHLAMEILKPQVAFVPALTFVSTALAPLYVGAEIVFVDIAEDTLCMDPNDLACKLKQHSERPGVVIPVHYAGRPARIRLIQDLARSHDCALVEDCAHAAGSYLNGIHLGNWGDLSVFSCHAVKNIASPDLGLVVTDCDDYIAPLKAMRWCGIDKSTWERSGKRYSWDYSIEQVGWKYHTSDTSAAIARVQLRRLPQTNARRREIVETYRAEIADLSWLRLPSPEGEGVISSWHLFAIRVPADHREALLDYLAEKGIGAGCHYKPLTSYSIFPNVSLPVTDRIWKELVTLPLFPDLTDDDLDRVIGAVRSFGKERCL